MSYFSLLFSSHVSPRSLLVCYGREVAAVTTIIIIPITSLLVDAILLMTEVYVDISHHYIKSFFLADAFHFHRRLVHSPVFLLNL